MREFNSQIKSVLTPPLGPPTIVHQNLYKSTDFRGSSFEWQKCCKSLCKAHNHDLKLIGRGHSSLLNESKVTAVRRHKSNIIRNKTHSVLNVNRSPC